MSKMKIEQEQRTIQQNKAMHKYFSEVAQALNEAGIAQSVFYENIEADYTMESIKELWRSFARAKYRKDSTADLSTMEVTEIYEEVNRHLSKFGIYLPFPSIEEKMNQI